jgi:hypothetical protein
MEGRGGETKKSTEVPRSVVACHVRTTIQRDIIVYCRYPPLTNKCVRTQSISHDEKKEILKFFSFSSYLHQYGELGSTVNSKLHM